MDTSKPAPTRRKFNKSLVALASAPLAMPTASEAALADPLPNPTAADGLVALLRARHGDHIAKEHLPAVTASILRNQLTAERMRKHELANGDEPDFVCSADLQ